MANCIFCKIINGEIPTDKIYEDDKVIAFNDINPQAPIHILIIPKTHIESLNEINDDNINLIAHMHKVVKHIAKEKNIDKKGYRVVVNCGEEGGQEVGHLHFHLLGGRKMTWPPG